MPTIRKFYTFKQYEEALRKFAFKHALEVFAKLPEAELKIVHHKRGEGYGYSSDWDSNESEEFTVKAKGPELIEVTAYPYYFTFRKRTVSVSYRPHANKGISLANLENIASSTDTSLVHWYFDVEEKIYSDSPHNSKLGYVTQTDKAKTKQQIDLINAFVDKLMLGIEPEQRFNLAKYKAAQDKSKVKVTAKPPKIAS